VKLLHQLRDRVVPAATSAGAAHGTGSGSKRKGARGRSGVRVCVRKKYIMRVRWSGLGFCWWRGFAGAGSAHGCAVSNGKRKQAPGKIRVTIARRKFRGSLVNGAGRKNQPGRWPFGERLSARD